MWIGGLPADNCSIELPLSYDSLSGPRFREFQFEFRVRVYCRVLGVGFTVWVLFFQVCDLRSRRSGSFDLGLPRHGIAEIEENTNRNVHRFENI